jgi:hypothetical protein
MVDIGATCIEAAENGSQLGFPTAISVCGELNRRLCAYLEWYRECKDLQGQVMNMTDNAQWVDEVYPDGDGGIQALLVGDGSCEAASLSRFITSAHNFRCCL